MRPFRVVDADAGVVGVRWSGARVVIITAGDEASIALNYAFCNKRRATLVKTVDIQVTRYALLSNRNNRVEFAVIEILIKSLVD